MDHTSVEALLQSRHMTVASQQKGSKQVFTAVSMVHTRFGTCMMKEIMKSLSGCKACRFRPDRRLNFASQLRPCHLQVRWMDGLVILTQRRCGSVTAALPSAGCTPRTSKLLSNSVTRLDASTAPIARVNSRTLGFKRHVTLMGLNLQMRHSTTRRMYVQLRIRCLESASAFVCLHQRLES